MERQVWLAERRAAPAAPKTSTAPSGSPTPTPRGSRPGSAPSSAGAMPPNSPTRPMPHRPRQPPGDRAAPPADRHVYARPPAHSRPRTRCRRTAASGRPAIHTRPDRPQPISLQNLARASPRSSVRRSTATSCCRTGSSAFWDADERPGKTSPRGPGRRSGRADTWTRLTSMPHGRAPSIVPAQRGRPNCCTQHDPRRSTPAPCLPTTRRTTRPAPGR
jgi:hypothetical protein